MPSFEPMRGMTSVIGLKSWPKRRFMKRRFGQDFNPMTEVIPLIGSKEGISHLALAYVTKGDYTIVPEPGYNSYLGGTLLSEATMYKYPLRPEENFLIDLDRIPVDVLEK